MALTKLPPLRGWSKAPDPNYGNRLLYFIETDVGEYQLKPRHTAKGKAVYSAWRGSVFISNHTTAAQAAKAAGKHFKWYSQTKANPHRSIKAHLRRLPSGEIQLKIPLSAKNVKAQVQAIRKALGRRVKSAVIVGGKIARKMTNPHRARRRKR